MTTIITRKCRKHLQTPIVSTKTEIIINYGHLEPRNDEMKSKITKSKSKTKQQNQIKAMRWKHLPNMYTQTDLRTRIVIRPAYKTKKTINRKISQNSVANPQRERVVEGIGNRKSNLSELEKVNDVAEAVLVQVV